MTLFLTSAMIKNIKSKELFITKRIIFLIMLLQLALVSVCSAFNPPQFGYWDWKGLDCWVSKYDRIYMIDRNPSHYAHRQVDFWICQYYPSKSQYDISHVVYDLTCRRYRRMEIDTFDSRNNKPISSSNDRSRGFMPVNDTYSQRHLRFAQDCWIYDSRNPYKGYSDYQAADYLRKQNNNRPGPGGHYGPYGHHQPHHPYY